MNLKEEIKRFWKWVWGSDSMLSYIVFLALIFILIKFIFLPLLGLIFNTQLPLAIVESSSMDHSYTKYCVSFNSIGECVFQSVDYSICGNNENNKQPLNFDSYWQTCGEWYEKNTNITKDQFEEYKLHNGFKKGDILILTNYRKPKIGDVILFQPNEKSLTRTPIIHRVVSLAPLQTKGDHNEDQLKESNNLFKTDETYISEDRIMGIAVMKIPWLGWIKLAVVEFWRSVF